jgi:hydroxymethylglutaryl-CoA reductase
MPTVDVNSRLPEFYRRPLEERLAQIVRLGVLSDDSARFLARGGGLDPAIADRMSENVIACAGLPFAVAVNFKVNGRDVLVPMAVEEPSVVAAASNAAKRVRASGGFFGEASAPIMTAQVQLEGMRDVERVEEVVRRARDRILAQGDRAISNLVARGGGCRDLDVRVLDSKEGVGVVHVYVDVRDAMGANSVDAVAEAVAPTLAELTQGNVGLRILSNLPIRRMVRVRARVSEEQIGGSAVGLAVSRASRFAELDPFRAVTHNKGIMNGVDAVCVALGQDWRAIEAGAHGFAAISGRYRPLATWSFQDASLCGEIHMPLAAATRGGSTRAHAAVRAAFELVGTDDARELAVIIASAGLATNLAALRALSSEGIQSGHMRLHRRKREGGGR